jgi:2,4-dienoyl-CoA reductase-like NADH-dependent reductase (Old Yellow Enzyme family)
MAKLFEKLTLRGVTLKNRIGMAPMCQYSAVDGVPGDWHLVNLGSRALGGCGLVVAEATAVLPEGRITPQCTGLWNDEQTKAWSRIVDFVHAHGAVAGIQLAHAGRKSSTAPPWEGGGQLPAWTPSAPSAVPFRESDVLPHAMSVGDIAAVRDAFVASAVRAVEAGFKVVQLHFAHGYLVHEFMSPLSNQRIDDYGGSFENRTRLAVEIARAVRAALPDDMPLMVRISATDWVDGAPSWDVGQSVALCALLREQCGVDLVDVSSGGLSTAAKMAVGPGYQVPFAAAVRAGAGVPTGAVGLITEPAQAEAILADGSADLVFLARELLRNPYWPLQAARALGVDVEWPPQMARAKPVPLPTGGK